MKSITKNNNLTNNKENNVKFLHYRTWTYATGRQLDGCPHIMSALAPMSFLVHTVTLTLNLKTDNGKINNDWMLPQNTRPSTGLIIKLVRTEHTWTNPYEAPGKTVPAAAMMTIVDNPPADKR